MTYVPVTGNVMSKFMPAPVFPSMSIANRRA